MSELRIGLLLKFFNNRNIDSKLLRIPVKKQTKFPGDVIKSKFSQKYLMHVQENVTIEDSFMKSKRNKGEKTGIKLRNGLR